MTTSRVLRLRALFSALVGTLGTTAGAALLPACSGDVSTITAADFDIDVCGDELEGVTPSAPVDYLEVRSDSDPSGMSPGSLVVVAKRGTPCATAQDQAACQSKLAALRPTMLQSPKAIDHFDGRYLVFTRGDEVSAVTTADDLRTFLAPFDDAKDGALLLTEFSQHSIPCDGANARKAGSGFELRTQTGFACGEGTHLDANIVSVSSTGAITVTETDRLQDGDPNCAVGRRPEGYSPSAKGTSLGAHFAMTAELEAASVPAFYRLARELRAHGASPDLVARAEKAAREEIQHARSMRKLAERFGGAPELPKIGLLAVRPLAAIAEENAREGCVRETFGALLATIQAVRSPDEAIRAAMETIAADETEHAALAWDVAAWLDTQIDHEARGAVRRAKQAAYESLLEVACADSAARGRESGRPEESEWLLLGLPSSEEELRLLEELAGVLFVAEGDVLGAAA